MRVLPRGDIQDAKRTKWPMSRRDWCALEDRRVMNASCVSESIAGVMAVRTTSDRLLQTSRSRRRGCKGATVMTKPIDDPIVSSRQLGGKARFLAFPPVRGAAAGLHRELSTAIIMRRLARSRPEHGAMTEGRETFPTAWFLDLLRFSRTTGAGLMKGSRK